MNIRSTDEIGGVEVWSTAGTRGVITGSPHTHPGRFDVLWDDDERPHPTSLSDLTRVSPAAELWLAGFLAGQSPDPHEVIEVSGDFLDETERAEWLAACREFQHTGKMPEVWLARRAQFEADSSD